EMVSTGSEVSGYATRHLDWPVQVVRADVHSFVVRHRVNGAETDAHAPRLKYYADKDYNVAGKSESRWYPKISCWQWRSSTSIGGAQPRRTTSFWCPGKA
ncbi:hypothetical protein F442_01486, partial [Phytophthora nicotianae P10297]